MSDVIDQPAAGKTTDDVTTPGDDGAQQNLKGRADSGRDSAELELGLDEPEQASPEQLTLQIETDSGEQAPPEYHSEPPPSYRPGTFRKSIKRAKEQSSGNVDFAKNVFLGLCCGTICCGFVVALNMAIPIAMTAIGSVYLYSCPRQRYIPIYLIVGGVFGLVRATISLVELIVKALRSRRSGRDHGRETTTRANPADGVVSCFLSAWFIAGCYWIYSAHGDYQSTDPSGPDYCHQTLYLFAFWLTTSAFIFMGAALLLSCAICIGVCVCVKK